jgi:outer membrane protein assembly factor BamE (lipoprotein component of BamABCDE complex)
MKLTPSASLGMVVALGLLIVTLAACGSSKLTQDNFDKIQIGMTRAQVVIILGNPTESSSVDMAVFSGTVSKWKQGDVIITIHFVNDKVVAKQFSKGQEQSRQEGPRFPAV